MFKQIGMRYQLALALTITLISLTACSEEQAQIGLSPETTAKAERHRQTEKNKAIRNRSEGQRSLLGGKRALHKVFVQIVTEGDSAGQIEGHWDSRFLGSGAGDLAGHSEGKLRGNLRVFVAWDVNGKIRINSLPVGKVAFTNLPGGQTIEFQWTDFDPAGVSAEQALDQYVTLATINVPDDLKKLALE